MKKNVRKKKQGKSARIAAQSQAAKNTQPKMGRREFLRYLRNGALAAPIVGGVAYYSVTSLQASICERDLSKIGNGKPAIVQIHDPQCNLCRRLQDQTRDILSSYRSDSYEYLIANVKTKKGSDFASRFSVPHVTLLLFSPEGKMVQVVRGPISSQNLKGYLSVHMNRYQGS